MAQKISTNSKNPRWEQIMKALSPWTGGEGEQTDRGFYGPVAGGVYQNTKGESRVQVKEKEK